MATSKRNNSNGSKSNGSNSSGKCCGGGKCHTKSLGRKRLVTPAPVKKLSVWDKILAFFKLD